MLTTTAVSPDPPARRVGGESAASKYRHTQSAKTAWGRGCEAAAVNAGPSSVGCPLVVRLVPPFRKSTTCVRIFHARNKAAHSVAPIQVRVPRSLCPSCAGGIVTLLAACDRVCTNLLGPCGIEPALPSIFNMVLQPVDSGHHPRARAGTHAGALVGRGSDQCGTKSLHIYKTG